MQSRPTQGFSYIAMLATVAVLGVGLAAIGQAWSDQQRREREADILRIGSLYAEAIARYHRMAPGSVKTYPATLQDLLHDPRFPGTVRHLRRLYPDPTNPKRPWLPIPAPEGGVQGVYITSAQAPVRQAPLVLGAVTLPPARHYHEWRFIPTVTP
ncbi:pilus assembly FimT family protein [Ideonella paludis]|uniref:pilus assembly FimT family protein n=1 Tax=Ideonella paludis TaxID=1233411 RepID=UPI0036397D57